MHSRRRLRLPGFPGWPNLVLPLLLALVGFGCGDDPVVPAGEEGGADGNARKEAEVLGRVLANRAADRVPERVAAELVRRWWSLCGGSAAEVDSRIAE